MPASRPRTSDPAAPRSLPGAVTAALVSADLPDASPDELAAAAAHVERSIGDMADSMRFGVRAVSLASGAVLAVLGGGRFRSQPPDRQQRLAERLGRLPLPAVGEFVRLTRGLGLVSVFEGRFADGAGAS